MILVYMKMNPLSELNITSMVLHEASFWHGGKVLYWFFIFRSFIQRCEQYAEYDAFIWAPDPSNPWVSDDVTLWEQDKSL